ncbi:MAG: NAD(P)/FAD-dependent oxidoreductase [Theionarchaea archaeon]|nr:NAD(P)/FAD-dependent oxidoreductase [Theionarchaea archaeon]MBU7037572.1 NAD(P)/FAD-dependent oxidoreductase [Theionarchaea archaeon]
MSDMTIAPYDLVIVGCGIAGAAAGLTALREDLTICIIERKGREFVGRKICGELMPMRIVKWLKNEFQISVDHYPLKGLQVCTFSGLMDGDHGIVRVTDPLCTIDRWQFGQTMVKELLRRGAELHQGVVRGSVGKNEVHGVKTHDASYLGTLTMDCSGVFSVLSRELRRGRGSPSRIGLGYKENIILEEAISQEYATIVFDNSFVPSGYFWFFPKGTYELNVGAGGMEQRSTHFRKAVAQALHEHTRFKIKEKTQAGYGALPLGGSLPSMVAPGLLACGDAARHTNPLTGEGIAPAFTAGHMAATTAAEAIHSKDTSLEVLWKYNYDFMQRYGALLGSSLPLRDFMVSLTSKELQSLLQNVITDEVLSQLEEKEPSFTLTDILTTAANAAKTPSLLFKLACALGKMGILRAVYSRYPKNPKRFPQWRTLATACGGV